ncbi:MAG: caspase family protein [Deltaproteobacteria bacterium]|nr:caspase family protein [Deltaproteobacteria bacterium]
MGTCKVNWKLICFVALALTLYIIKPCHALEDYKMHYLQAVDFETEGKCEEAITEFSKALVGSSSEQEHVRFYGMRYGEYFPHREKGICHYLLKQYKHAAEELEISLAQVPTEKARKYLDRVKAEIARGAREAVIETVETPEELKQMKRANSENRYAVAVVIGNRDYRHRDIPSVNYAVQDAEMVKECLMRTFGYRMGNIILENNATKGTFENIFGSATEPKGKLHDYIKPGKSDIFIYYSGHGAPDIDSRRGYLLPVDGDPNNITITGYPLDLLYKNLASLPYHSLTIVTDACFSGALILKKASPVGIIVQNPLMAMKNVAVINSSRGTELSSWYPEKGHGLFTYYFLLGFTGKADTNSDGKITVSELRTYINDMVPYTVRKLYSGRKQTPTVTTQNAEKVLATYR